MDLKDEIKSIPNVTAANRGSVTPGTFNITRHHIVFRETLESPDRLGKQPRVSYIPFPLIRNATFRPVPPNALQKASISIQTRDFTFIKFQFETTREAAVAFQLVRAFGCRVGKIESLFAFSYVPTKKEREFNGWDIYDARAEFRRQGIAEDLPNQTWRISTINQDHKFSPTYPELLVVPAVVSDNVLKHAGPYRSRERIPTLVYLHPVNNCTITRSSQPMLGITYRRCLQDERLIAACFSALHLGPSSSQLDLANASTDQEVAGQPTANANYDAVTGKRLRYGAQQTNLIVDARPGLNATANQAQGKGSENMSCYKCARKEHLPIGNIHVMRKSLDIVFQGLEGTDISPLSPSRSALNSSDWLSHISSILAGAVTIAERIGIQHSNVLIHCSDGWDRTSQLTSLAQIMLDPYFRTLKGFMVLVEKEWLSFGHKFNDRLGVLGHESWYKISADTEMQTDSNERFRRLFSSTLRLFQGQSLDDFLGEQDEQDPSVPSEPSVTQIATDEVSPIFHQFLDATQQIVRQFPHRFEYTEGFLRRLFYHTYSCQYGTFLFNSEKERRVADLRNRTRSVWDLFLAKREAFINPNYDGQIDDNARGRERLLLPQHRVHADVKWWFQLFGRSNEEMNGNKSAVNLDTDGHLIGLVESCDGDSEFTAHDQDGKDDNNVISILSSVSAGANGQNGVNSDEARDVVPMKPPPSTLARNGITCPDMATSETQLRASLNVA